MFGKGGGDLFGKTFRSFIMGGELCNIFFKEHVCTLDSFTFFSYSSAHGRNALFDQQNTQFIGIRPCKLQIHSDEGQNLNIFITFLLI